MSSSRRQVSRVLLYIVGTLALAGGGALAFFGLNSPKGPSLLRQADSGAALQARGLEPAQDRKLVWMAAGEQWPAIALRTDDGENLDLVRVRSGSVVDGPLVFTQLRLAFKNAEARRVEGRLTIALPPSASVNRFAMKQGGQWREAHMVEAQRAHRVYGDSLHTEQAPTLDRGTANEFSARVFPIEAQKEQELIISYDQELSAVRTPIVLLAGLQALESLDVTVHHRGRNPGTQVLRTRAATPPGDLALNADPRDSALRSGNLVVARVEAPSTEWEAQLRSVLFAVDTSASRALGLEEQARTLTRLLALLSRDQGATTPVAVLAFDQSAELLFEGTAAEAQGRVENLLLSRGALGATDLAAGLAQAAKVAEGDKYDRLVLLTDGISTLGTALAERTPDRLSTALTRLHQTGVRRLDVIVFGSRRDGALMDRLVGEALDMTGVVIDAAAGASGILDRLRRPVHRLLKVEVAGASWTSPKELKGLQSGDHALVYARTDNARDVSIRVGWAEATVFKPRESLRPLVERAGARQRIREMLKAKRKTPELLDETVSLSRKYRVLTPQTAMVLLDPDLDYALYGIDRLASSQVLEVQDGSIGIIQPQERTNAAFGSGQQRLRAVGMVGGRLAWQEVAPVGSRPSLSSWARPFCRHGSLTGSYRGKPPRIRISPVSVEGSLPQEVVQRVVRQIVGRWRLCYERRLEKEPHVEGKLRIRFLITPTGRVSNPSLVASTLPDTLMVSCFLQAFSHLTFPKPKRGTVAVTVPIDLSNPGAPGGGYAAHPRATPRPALSRTPNFPERAEPYSGRMKEVLRALNSGRPGEALRSATAWVSSQPGQRMAYVALGRALAANGRLPDAERAFGSLVDLLARRAGIYRFSGALLEELKGPTALSLSGHLYAQARAMRPGQLSSYRLGAYLLVKQAQFEAAFRLLEQALQLKTHRPMGVERVLREDLGLIAAAWARAEPKKRSAIRTRLSKSQGQVEDKPSLRFVLNWETDGSDMDLHVYNGAGGHAYWVKPELSGGGELYGDVTGSDGPECFSWRGPLSDKRPLSVQAHHYTPGSMGVGMGRLQVVRHDGDGKLTVQERPFVVMQEGAYVDLGSH